MIMYPIEFNGGPHDGIVTFLPEPFFEVLQPRGDAADKPLDAGEAEFNMSLTGRPYNTDVTYERYQCSGKRIIRTILLHTGETVGPMPVMIYKHTGVVGASIDGDLPGMNLPS